MICVEEEFKKGERLGGRVTVRAIKKNADKRVR
jgi:hypothetical protein